MLKDKIVLITGASAGIGSSVAEKFSQSGAKVILIARRSDRLKEIAESLPFPAHTIELDIRDHSSVQRAINNLPSGFKEIDILINNAGLGKGLDKLHEGSVEGWEAMIDTNIKGLLFVSRAVLPGMVSRGRGHVINLGSIAGHQVYPGGNVYCATKHAVDALTKGMLIDLVDTPIRVSTIDPGLVETEFSLVRFDGDSERAEKTYQGYEPLVPDDIAEAAIWVASRPPHVQIAGMTILPSAQGSALHVHKKA